MHIESPSIDDSTNSAEKLVAGKREIADLFTIHRKRLLQIVRFRLDQRLHGRVDPEDILQEAYLDVLKRRDPFRAKLSLFVQIRQFVLQTMIDVHRRHLKVKARDVKREQPIDARPESCDTSITLARLLTATVSSPSSPLRKAETYAKLHQALESLGAVDCEVLLMRHFEDMSNSEVADALSINPATSCQRYFRALARLKVVLESQTHFRE